MGKAIAINKDNKLNNFLSYFLVYAMLAVQGMEYWFRSRIPLSIGLLFIVFIIASIYRVRINKKALLLILPLVAIGLIRSLVFQKWLVAELLINFLLFLYIAPMLGKSFWKYFCNLMVFFSIASLFLWFLQTMGWAGWIENGIAPLFKIDNKNIELSNSYNIIIHNFFIPPHSEYLIRNSGPFWEPGLFAAHLCFGLFAERFFLKKKKNSLFSWRSLAMTGAIITTFSSAGYIALLVILLCGLFVSRINIVPKYILLIVVLAGSFFAYNNIPFLKEKIEGQQEKERNLSLASIKYERNISRFASAIIHFEMINSSPMSMLIGFDEIKRTNYVQESGLVSGLTQVFLIYGYPVGIYYYILLFMALWKICASVRYNRKTLFAFLLAMALVIGFSQDLPTRGFYYFLIVLAFVAYRKT